MPDKTPVTAGTVDQDRVYAALVAAFLQDPLMRWVFPDSLQYLRCFPLMLRPFAGAAFAHGCAWRSADFNAAALWLPPGVSPDEQALGAVMGEAVMPDRRSEVFDLFQRVAAERPASAYHYLPVIGVEPLSRGRGHASALLARGIEACDRDGVAAYLEATNPANVPLYRRFGFEVVGEIQVGDSPVVTRMYRGARPLPS